MLLLVAAGVANLPLVHAVLSLAEPPALAVFGAGLLSMGLAWAGGCAIEGRRHGSIVILGSLGLAEAVVPLVPWARESLGDAAIVWPLVAAAASGAALVLLARDPRRAGATSA